MWGCLYVPLAVHVMLLRCRESYSNGVPDARTAAALTLLLIIKRQKIQEEFKGAEVKGEVLNHS